MAKKLGTTMKIVAIDEADSFTTDDGKEIKSQTMLVEITGTVRVAAYGSNVDTLASMKAEPGDELVFITKKPPSIQVR